ncbi:hypothetical protein ACP275_03G032100 [Erythranthe tilingii]
MNRHLIFILLFLGFLLMSIFTTSPSHFMVQGTQLLPGDNLARTNGERKMILRSQLIGSRPPRCGGSCEAVQIPIIAPKIMKLDEMVYSTIAYSRGDHISNYKPICWKCKCGHLIFDP